MNVIKLQTGQRVVRIHLEIDSQVYFANKSEDGFDQIDRSTLMNLYFAFG